MFRPDLAATMIVCSSMQLICDCADVSVCGDGGLQTQVFTMQANVLHCNINTQNANASSISGWANKRFTPSGANVRKY